MASLLGLLEPSRIVVVLFGFMPLLIAASGPLNDGMRRSLRVIRLRSAVIRIPPLARLRSFAPLPDFHSLFPFIWTTIFLI